MSSTMTTRLALEGSTSRSYTRAVRTVEERQRALGEQAGQIGKRLAAAGDVVRYTGQLKDLSSRQAGAGLSSRRLARQIEATRKRLASARYDLGRYGVAARDAARALVQAAYQDFLA